MFWRKKQEVVSTPTPSERLKQAISKAYQEAVLHVQGQMETTTDKKPLEDSDYDSLGTNLRVLSMIGVYAGKDSHDSIRTAYQSLATGLGSRFGDGADFEKTVRLLRRLQINSELLE